MAARVADAPLIGESDAEAALHDATNALAAARSYAEILRGRSRIGMLFTPEPLLEDLVEELDRIAALLKDVRSNVRPPFR